jgi:superfamily II DNA or RNA helicase
VSFAPGSIVKARGRDWIVLPESTGELVRVQPLGGTAEEITAILTDVEKVESSTFPPPTLEHLGDHRSAWLMWTAARLGNRNTTGPFRSISKIRVKPRPYQYVPLLMALRQPTTRILIGDDVGIGKTIEALLIARELMDRGEIRGFCVLCPPHLAEQWQREIEEKFHLDVCLYLARTADKVHRDIGRADVSVFDRNPVVVASIDYVKQTSRRATFIREAPDLIIVDEAHTCTTGGAQSPDHLRYELVEALANDRERDRHIVLVTATPHTGNEEAFRRLLTLLDHSLGSLPDDLSGPHRQRERERLAQFLVQRRRKDLEVFLEETPFPEFKEKEEHYTLHPEYRALIEEIIETARGKYRAATTEKGRRIQYWSLLSILRALASSPEAAAATLTVRSGIEAAKDDKEANRIGQEQAFEDAEDEVARDTVIGGRVGDDPLFDKWAKRCLQLSGEKDKKLATATVAIDKLVKDGRNVIVFCQFIQTANYVAAALREKFKNHAVGVVTGEHNPQDREQRIAELAKAPKRILVATDCLSEGVNLQHAFDAVFHYDLSWNPTRHEQRDGRVDRLMQKSKTVASITYYGTDNFIDGIVLDVLLRKHTKIRKTTGVSVPVPQRSQAVMEAIMDSLFFRKQSAGQAQLTLANWGVENKRAVAEMHDEWENRAEKEKGSPTLFAQRSIKDQEVEDEIRALHDALSDELAAPFFEDVLKRLGAGVRKNGNDFHVVTAHMDADAKDILDLPEEFDATFATTAPAGVLPLHRTHPLVEALCHYAIETAVDDLAEKQPASRANAIFTDAVEHVTYLYLTRFRYRLRQQDRRGRESDRIVEEIALLGYDADEERWMTNADLRPLLSAKAAENMPKAQQAEFLQHAIERYVQESAQVRGEAEARCRDALRSHRRVRDAAKAKLGQIRMEPVGEPDLIGVYSYHPSLAGLLQ